MPQPPLDPAFGTPLIELQSVDSTNNYALRLIHEGLAQEGTTVFAHNQTIGKGQRGKSWNSEPGKNLIMSLTIRPRALLPTEQFRLNCTMAVSVFEFFSKYAGEDTRIKWPNDLYWRDRKAGGLLIENVIRTGAGAPATWDWSVVGIGININQTSFDPGMGRPVSLKQITGNSFPPVQLARELSGIMQRNLKELQEGAFPQMLLQYNSKLFRKGEIVQLKQGPRSWKARIAGVNAAGNLVTAAGDLEEELGFGEVEWVL